MTEENDTEKGVIQYLWGRWKSNDGAPRPIGMGLKNKSANLSMEMFLNGILNKSKRQICL